jgi:predicted amidohydrolase YtcJ
MLTLPTTPEFETRLQSEAAKRGLEAPEYALRLIEGLLAPEKTPDAAERERLAAIDELMGLGIGAGFTTADLHRERQEEREREEENEERLFEWRRVA